MVNYNIKCTDGLIIRVYKAAGSVKYREWSKEERSGRNDEASYYARDDWKKGRKFLLSGYFKCAFGVFLSFFFRQEYGFSRRKRRDIGNE